MHVACRGTAGRADPADDPALGNVLAHRNGDLRQVVVGRREALAGTLGVAQHDPIAVPAGPACVYHRPRQRRHGRIPTRLPEIDTVMPALSVGERVGPIAEPGGGGVVTHRPPDQVTFGPQLRAVGDHSHRVGDQVAGLDQTPDQCCDAQRSGRGGARTRGGCDGAGLRSHRHGQHDVGQGPADEGYADDQERPAADPASELAPGWFDSSPRPISAGQLHKAPLVAFLHDYPSRGLQKRAGAIIGSALRDSGYADSSGDEH